MQNSFAFSQLKEQISSVLDQNKKTLQILITERGIDCSDIQQLLRIVVWEYRKKENDIIILANSANRLLSMVQKQEYSLIRIEEAYQTEISALNLTISQLRFQNESILDDLGSQYSKLKLAETRADEFFVDRIKVQGIYQQEIGVLTSSRVAYQQDVQKEKQQLCKSLQQQIQTLKLKIYQNNSFNQTLQLENIKLRNEVLDLQNIVHCIEANEKILQRQATILQRQNQKLNLQIEKNNQLIKNSQVQIILEPFDSIWEYQSKNLQCESQKIKINRAISLESINFDQNGINENPRKLSDQISHSKLRRNLSKEFNFSLQVMSQGIQTEKYQVKHSQAQKHNIQLKNQINQTKQAHSYLFSLCQYIRKRYISDRINSRLERDKQLI